jgi:hypothetical protein
MSQKLCSLFAGESRIGKQSESEYNRTNNQESGGKRAIQSLCGQLHRSPRRSQKLLATETRDEENKNWETKPPQYVCTGRWAERRPQASSHQEKARTPAQQFYQRQKERHQAGEIIRRRMIFKLNLDFRAESVSFFSFHWRRRKREDLRRCLGIRLRRLLKTVARAPTIFKRGSNHEL